MRPTALARSLLTLRTPARRALGVLAVTLATAGLAGRATAAPVQADDPLVAPATTLSADGRTVSGAGRSLSVSQASGLAANGQAISVSGTGYKVDKGIYLALCVIPPTNMVPTPCGGGADMTGSSGASAWISSNPPSYAAGLTQPYGPGGSFTTTLTVSPGINARLDCYSVRCAIVSRNDHTRTSDRSQDLFVPVTFAAPGASGTTTTTQAPPPPPPPPTTAPPPDPSTIPPVTELSADGLSVTDGARTVSVSAADELDPAGDEVTVQGEGFDPAAGIYVALCAAPTDGSAPGPCRTGDGAAAWVLSDPPDYASDLAEAFGQGGTFEVTLTVSPVIDGTTDCREVACTIGTRSDDAAPDDRTRDLLVPVTFGETRPTTTATTEADDESTDEVAAGADDGGSSGGIPVAPIVGAVAVLAVAAAAAVVARRRRQAAG